MSKEKEVVKLKYAEKYYLYLDVLCASGIVSTFGAKPFFRSKFRELSDPMATKVLGDWMKTFSERHPKGEKE